MFLIEPCCVKRHLRELRDSITRGATKQFEGYGDLSLTELLPALLTRYSETNMMIVAPTLPDQAAEIISEWMGRQWARMDGKGKLDVIHHLTIIARLEKDSSHYITAWMEEKPFGDRLTLVDMEQEDTAILLPDFAITGPVNMQYNRRFTATATTEPEKVKALWERYTEMTENAPVMDFVEETEDEEPAAEPERPAKKKAARKKRKR